MNLKNVGKVLIPAGFAACTLLAMADLAQAADAPGTYKEHCASCHGEARLGGIGPALLPENLARLRKPEAEKVIREGRPATQMLGFGDKLSGEEIKALVPFRNSSPTRPRASKVRKRSAMPITGPGIGKAKARTINSPMSW